MAASNKVIITCAVTGSDPHADHVGAPADHPDEIAHQAVDAAEAGAAILHLHARNPEDGSPTPDPAVFGQFLPRIKQQTDAVVNITTGGGHGMTLQERLAAALDAKPEMTSLNMGSMNFGLYPVAEKYTEWKYPWEKPFLEASRDFIFRNTFADMNTS